MSDLRADGFSALTSARIDAKEVDGTENTL